MARFVKGAERPINAGRKRGSVNKKTAILKEAILLAAELEGDQDLRKTARLNGETDEEIAKRGGLVGYLRWQARNHPAPFSSLLGRVLPMQVRVDAHTDVTYRTVAEVGRDMAARGFAIADVAQLWIEAHPVEDCEDEQKDEPDAA